MGEKQERIQATVPKENDWRLEDLEGKAKELGIDKSSFIFTAVDMFMHFDKDIFDYVGKYAKGLHVPAWMVIQNMIVKRMAEEAAEHNVNGKKHRELPEFRAVMDDLDDMRMLTGKELYDIMYKQFKADCLEDRLKRIKNRLVEYGAIHPKDIEFLRENNPTYYSKVKDYLNAEGELLEKISVEDIENIEALEEKEVTKKQGGLENE